MLNQPSSFQIVTDINASSNDIQKGLQSPRRNLGVGSSIMRKPLSLKDIREMPHVPDPVFDSILSSTEISALKIKDAVAGRFRSYRLQKDSISWYILFHKTWYRILFLLVCWLHVFLIVFEPATSVNMSRNSMLRHQSNNRNRTVDQFLPLSHYGKQTKEYIHDVTSILEAIFICMHWLDTYVQFRMAGGSIKRVSTLTWFRVKIGTVSLMSLNMLVSLCFIFYMRDRPFNFTRILRPVLLVERLTNVRKLLLSVVQSFYEIRNVLIGLFSMTFFSAIVATALFRGITGHGPGGDRAVGLSNSTCRFLGPSPNEIPDLTFCSTFSKNCTDYFKTIWHSLMHLFTLLTTANYPDVMMPVVECEPFFFLFFAFFIFLGLFFLLNLVLAIVTNTFHTRAEERMKVANKRRAFLLSDGFARVVMVLTDQSSINKASGQSAKFHDSAKTCLPNFNFDVGWAGSRVAIRLMKEYQSSGRSHPEVHREHNQNCCQCIQYFWHNQRKAGGPDITSVEDLFDSNWTAKTTYECGDIVIASERSAAEYLASQIVLTTKKSINSSRTDHLDRFGGVGIRVSKSGPLLDTPTAPDQRNTSPDTLQIFVCCRSNTGENPVIEQRKSFIHQRDKGKDYKHNNAKSGQGGEALAWKELRLTAKAWKIFTKRHFPSLNQEYAIGHFNFLFKGRCASHLEPVVTRVESVAYGAMFKEGFTCDTDLREEYSVSYGDFVKFLLPLLDAVRVDTVCGLRLTSLSTLLSQRYSWLQNLRKELVGFFENACVSYFFDALVVTNSLLLITEFHHEDTSGMLRAKCDQLVISICYIQVVILYIFLVELALKITGYGFVRFWRSSLNQIDFFAILFSFFFLAYNGSTGCTPDSASSECVNGLLTPLGGNETSLNAINSQGNQDNFVSSMSNFGTIFRLIRIMRLLRVLRSVRVELRVIKRLAPLFLRFLGVLFFYFYVFAVIGMESFAGIMDSSMPAVAQSSYGLSQYYMNRFDNIYLTVMTLFELMVVNNWNIIMEGYVAATGTEWTRLYFILWFLVIVIVVMNVCAGFIIDSYTLLKPKMAMEVTAFSEIVNEAQRIMAKQRHRLLREIGRQGSFQRLSAMTKEYLCGIKTTNLSNLTFSELISRLDFEYLLESRSDIFIEDKYSIIFDQCLQQQLGIMVVIHQHSYDHLHRLFSDSEHKTMKWDDNSVDFMNAESSLQAYHSEEKIWVQNDAHEVQKGMVSEKHVEMNVIKTSSDS